MVTSQFKSKSRSEKNDQRVKANDRIFSIQILTLLEATTWAFYLFEELSSGNSDPTDQGPLGFGSGKELSLQIMIYDPDEPLPI